MDDDSKLPARKRLDNYHDYPQHDDARIWQHVHGVPEENFLNVVVKRTGMTEAPCLELTIERDATVLNLKTLIQDELADESPCLMVPVHRQRLIFQGKMLTDNDLALVTDVKMKPEQANYVHLAPLPNGVKASQRRQNENKLTTSASARRETRNRRRAARRAQRAFNPYTTNLRISESPVTPPITLSSSTPPAQRSLRSLSNQIPPASSALCDSARLPLNPIGLGAVGPDTHLATTSLAGMLANATPSLSPEAMLAEPRLGRPRDLFTDSANRSTTEALEIQSVLSLCRLLPSSLAEHVAARNLFSDQASTEGTILILDDMSQRCASLSATLRASSSRSTAPAPTNLPIALQGFGLPLGYF